MTSWGVNNRCVFSLRSGRLYRLVGGPEDIPRAGRRAAEGEVRSLLQLHTHQLQRGPECQAAAHLVQEQGRLRGAHHLLGSPAE